MRGSSWDGVCQTYELGNLGVAWATLGNTGKAIEYYEQRLVIAKETGDQRAEGSAWGNLADLADRSSWEAIADSREQGSAVRWTHSTRPLPGSRLQTL